MPLASALELVLNHYDIFDVDDLVAILRSPHDACKVADLIDGHHELIDATAGTAHVEVQTEPATATVGTMESVVNVREVGSMATFSPTTGARMVIMEVQCSPARPPQMVERAVQVKAPVVRHASVSASVSTANASSSTSHYLVVGVGMQHSSSQTETPEQPEPEQPEPEAEQPRGKPEPESHPEGSSSQPVTQPEQEKFGPEPQSKSPETEKDLAPPPVFADSSHYKHYNATPMTSRGRERRRARECVVT